MVLLWSVVRLSALRWGYDRLLLATAGFGSVPSQDSGSGFEVLDLFPFGFRWASEACFEIQPWPAVSFGLTRSGKFPIGF
jgi:hypothetical protein